MLKNKSFDLNNALRNYSSVCAFLFFALSLIAPSGYSYGPALLALISLVFIFNKKSYLNLDFNTKLLIVSFFAFSFIWLLEILIHHQSFKIEKPIRFFFSIAILLYLLRYPPKQAYVWAGIASGGIGTGIFSIISKVTTNIERTTGFSHNAIQYGNISILLGFLSLVGILWALQQDKQKKTWVIFLSLGFVLGVIASMLSGSRGGWLGVPLIILYLLIQFKNLYSKKIAAALFASFILIITASYLIPQTGVKSRIDIAIKELNLYQQGKTKTSVGTRLEFWRAAIIASKEKPIFGWGGPAYIEKLKELKAQKIVAPAIISDPHNMYLTMLAFRGIIGLVSLLFLFAVPLYIFRKRINPNDKTTIPIAIAGITTALCFIDFGLTQTTLKFNSGTTVFCFSIVILYAATFRPERPIKKTNI